MGHGFDLHRLAPGLKLILGGVDIPHTKGCEAHSDGATAGLLISSAPVSLDEHVCAAFVAAAFEAALCPLRSQRARFVASPSLIRRRVDVPARRR